MSKESPEARARGQLPLVRFFQSYVPLPLARWLNRQALKAARLPPGVRREALSAGGVACEWLIPEKAASDRTLLYLHGGAFVFGQTAPHVEMVARLCQRMSMRALLVDYRLAPEHPFPAPLDDCLAAYRWLLGEGFSPHNVVVAGDSAGANFALAMLMRLRDNGEPLPAAAACLSPAADLSAEPNLSEAHFDPLLPARARRFYRKAYVGKNDPCDPMISPALGDYRGLPPLLVHAGEDEILREDALRVGQAAEAAGIEVRVRIFPRMWHVWQVFLSLPESMESLDEIAAFLKGHLPRLDA